MAPAVGVVPQAGRGGRRRCCGALAAGALLACWLPGWLHEVRAGDAFANALAATPSRSAGRKTTLVRASLIDFPNPFGRKGPELDEDGFADAELKKLDGELTGMNLLLTSSVFGFTDFKSVVELQATGSRWYGGMTSKEPGLWILSRGEPEAGERPEDIFLQLSQPMTDQYKDVFSLSSDSCYWKGRLTLKRSSKGKIEQVKVEGGLVTSLTQDGRSQIREGVFSAVDADYQTIMDTRKAAKEAIERALATPKAESTGFKTAARIAGIRRTSKPTDKMLKAAREDPTKLLEDD